jgi:hypothetical protein
MEEYLQRIEAMGLRIGGYVRFMGKAGDMAGTSDEAKRRAIVQFYERLVVVERQLGRIHEALQLG